MSRAILVNCIASPRSQARANASGSRTRINTLTRDTREDNARFFDSMADVPTHCITMGVGTIMECRQLLLFAFGEAKAAIIAQAVEGPITAMVPASALQLHQDVKIILEEADTATRQMAQRLVPGTGFELVVVSPGTPQTKPRALNLALMLARGELVTIYDAEDIPQPSQLRLAAECFHAADPSVACLQARLAYYNSNENWLTRQFTIEYATLFDLILPTLARWRLPLPLGGTSNHFRHAALVEAGGWDAWNVTEDADLGLRLARLGYRCEVLSSTTFEEANCRLGNWMHQRARWLKGWMQTWLVLMRQPFLAWRQMGTAGFLTAQLMMAGMIGSALLHPVFLTLTVHDLITVPYDSLGIAGQIARISAILVLIAGYGAAMAAGAYALAVRRLHPLLPSVLTMPVYWLLISAAGWLALWQFLRAPFHWNKTAHGISRQFSEQSEQ